MLKLRSNSFIRILLLTTLMLSLSLGNSIRAMQDNYSDSTQVKPDVITPPLSDSLYSSLFNVTPKTLELVYCTVPDDDKKPDRLIENLDFRTDYLWHEMDLSIEEMKVYNLRKEGYKIPVVITGIFPNITTDRKIRGVIIPVLKSEIQLNGNNLEILGDSIYFHGVDVDGKGITIDRNDNTNFAIKTSFYYYYAFKRSELYLRFKTTVNGKDSLLIPDIKVADGVNTTISLFDENEFIVPAFSFGKYYDNDEVNSKANIMADPYAIDIMDEDWQSDEFNDWLNFVKLYNGNSFKTSKLNVVVTSYLLPDEKYSISNELAADRGNHALRSLKKYFKQNKIKAQISMNVVRRTWDDIKKLIKEESGLNNKDSIIQAIDFKYADQPQFSAKKIPDNYIHIADSLLPLWQNVKLNATYTMGKTLDEINSEATKFKNYKKFSLDEQLSLIIYSGIVDISYCYKYFTEKHKKDYRVWNNLAICYYMIGDSDDERMQKAVEALNMAERLAPNAPEVIINKAIFALRSGNLDYLNNNETINKLEEAGKSYNKKSKLKLFQLTNMNPADELLGNYYLKKGDYEKALKAYGNNKSCNALLAHIMNKDYEKTRYVSSNRIFIPNSESSAKEYYLLAILKARMSDGYSNEKLILDYLTTAYSYNRELLLYNNLLNDLEFDNHVSKESMYIVYLLRKYNLHVPNFSE